MMAQDRATAREPAQQTDRADLPTGSAGPMALQSGRGYEATPQAFVRLSGSHLAKPRSPRAHITE
ncbi:hypothetical protein [Bradyrhizobium sp. BR13661]|uniref:hypothetical protein n=1 Tax=Bradyrhizobium sp. BR13661 TaxID=2940622 RepID=UPI00247567B5|nr:hypothetical protein [Bradyrhizobium sp. BR13661]MDH6262527.1 hypothetical protein [Bradyrhizobium sp. BR13661]